MLSWAILMEIKYPVSFQMSSFQMINFLKTTACPLARSILTTNVPLGVWISVLFEATIIPRWVHRDLICRDMFKFLSSTTNPWSNTTCQKYSSRGSEEVLFHSRVIRDRMGVGVTTTCVIRAYHHKSCEWLATGRWFFPGTLVSSTNKNDCHDIAEILLKVALNTANQNKPKSKMSVLTWLAGTFWSSSPE